MTDRPNINDLLLLWEDSLARQRDVAGGNLPELPGTAAGNPTADSGTYGNAVDGGVGRR